MLFIIILIILLFFLMRKDTVYERAYNLGVNYLNNTKIVPGYAVMFDIDDTLLSIKNYKPIKPIIELIRECNKRDILVLIITARDDMYTKETIEDLINLHIFPENFSNKYPKDAVFYDFLYLRHSPEENNDHFKSNVKKKLAQAGIITIMSVGDNEIDVLGKYSGYALKLPNKSDPRLFHKN